MPARRPHVRRAAAWRQLALTCRCTLLRYLQLNDSGPESEYASDQAFYCRPQRIHIEPRPAEIHRGWANSCTGWAPPSSPRHRLSKRLSAEKSSAWSPIDRHAGPQHEQHLLERICRPDVLRSSSVNQAWLRLTLWGVVAIVLVVVYGSQNLSRKH